MIKRPFFGCMTPVIRYEGLTPPYPELIEIAPPERVTLFYDAPYERTDAVSIKPGDPVKTGQAVVLYEGKPPMISPVTGRVADFSAYTGDFGRRKTAVTVDVDPVEVVDDKFADTCESADVDVLKRYLSGIPGTNAIPSLENGDQPIHTIIVCGLDQDLMLATNPFVIAADFERVKNGIGILKKVSGVEKIILAVHRDTLQGAGHVDAELKAVDNIYPSAGPIPLINSCLGIEVPAGNKPEDMGICFFSAEAAAAIGRAFEDKKVPTDKMITVIDKKNIRHLVKARIGTPISNIFKALNIVVNEGDRIVSGGPMTGSAIYSEIHPVQSDTDGIMVQDKNAVSFTSTYPCVNCGECIGVCPARIQVHMLVRLLEFGAYEQAADEYDLLSCVECGLCDVVCPSRIPVFQYIRLGKYELSRMAAQVEESKVGGNASEAAAEELSPEELDA